MTRFVRLVGVLVTLVAVLMPPASATSLRLLDESQETTVPPPSQENQETVTPAPSQENQETTVPSQENQETTAPSQENQETTAPSQENQETTAPPQENQETTTSPPPQENNEAMATMPPQLCNIENGVDYVGNDITHKFGTVGQCCYFCANTPGCKAWTWSTYNRGTCWLKWARGQVVANPYVKSAVLGSSTTCQLQQNVDYVNHDIAHIPSASPGGCCNICRNYAGCRAFSWSNYNGGTCWLKSQVTQTIYKQGVISARVYTDPQYNCPNLQYSIDYVDNDIANRPAAVPEACCNICRATPGCRAFSWSKHNGGTCWLKSQKGPAVYNPGVISGQIYSNPPPCQLQYDVDYVDHDFANVQNIPDPTNCCAICRGRSGCKAFSWSNYNGGTCWLKTAKGTVIAKQGIRSATI